MNNVLRKVWQGQSGYSLIETVMAVAIVGVLAAISAVSISDTITNSKQSRLKSELAVLQAVADRWKANNNNQHPVADATLAANNADAMDFTLAGLVETTKTVYPDYISTKPSNDAKSYARQTDSLLGICFYITDRGKVFGKLVAAVPASNTAIGCAAIADYTAETSVFVADQDSTVAGTALK